MCRILLCVLMLFDFSIADLENAHKRHEYQFTFKGPSISPPNSNEIPFFNAGGHVIVGKDRVRLTASLPNQQGWIWSKNTSSFDGFQIDLVFKITGNGRIGADGLALWVVQSSSFGGPALGGSASWHGLGILFDTYDNNGHGRNPFVVGIVNDGTKIYSPYTDGKDISVGHCMRDFRNLPFSTLCRVTYFNKVLVVAVSSGLSHHGTANEMEECFRANVEIPKSDYYFGLTSSTGTLADDHDVEKLEVHSLTEMATMKAEDDKKRYEEQKRYEEEYQHKLDNIAKTETEEDKSKTELGSKGISQNLMGIWQEIAGQHNTMKELVKSIGLIHDGMAAGEKGVLLAQLDLTRKEVIDVKNALESVGRKMENSGNAIQNQQSFTQIHNSIDGLKTDISKIFEKMNFIQQTVNHIKSNENMPPATDNNNNNNNCGSCISFSIMIILGSLQSLVVIGFLIYQKSRDNAAKKFY